MQGAQVHGPVDRRLIHSIPVSYSIDGSKGIRDPRGMFAEKLGVDMHVVTAAAGAVKNLTTCVARCHLEPRAIVVSPYAAGLASLVDDEMDLGVTVIDMGAGTTSLAVFFDGHVVYTDFGSHRRRPCHQRHRARPVDAARACGAHQDALRQLHRDTGG